MEKRTSEDPNDDLRGSTEPSKAVSVPIFRVFVYATETYRQLALGSGLEEVYDGVGTVSTR
jgi:hypothetical protein